ncbi:D-sedoheptulose 7-phosphate isomerase [Fulvivirga sp. RKSG066]|uniref:D-sedoheptulose 7-phosphate isomerase n=1 Tax=Fulvivirga aurantia TaxID=2529383 RepID=UPI0012BCB250|nr:D-sedoheptulose 7-phosphate isomerase [Fulvivirga aurantia]MTI23018.1 D-sedoheptulose 7-phosphate isomerase [Fulvivirga aurantia]
MDSMSMIKHELLQASDVLDDFLQDQSNFQKIDRAAELLISAFKDGNKVISCGNGGSHCDAMHFAEELTGRFRDDRNPLPAIAISDPSYISCVGNDYGFDQVYARYVNGVGSEGDVLMAISTSGKSKNVVRAAEAAKRKGMKVVALTGNSGGELGEIADLEIRVPYYGYADRIQEIHIKIIHVLILLIEKQS